MTQQPLLDGPPADPVVVEDQALGPAVGMFERLARDPSVDVEKLKELIALQEHVLAKQAESAFWEAFAIMQGELPTIDEDGRILVGDVVRSRYSTNEILQETIRPILAQHGFALSFRNRVTEKDTRIVRGILAHRAGHKEFDEFESKPDDGGSMNTIQRIGSQRSYGARYTTIALCNIVSRAKQDRDTDGGPVKELPPPPTGYDPWFATLEGLAGEGIAAFEKAWANDKVCPPDFRRHLASTAPTVLASLKTKARKVKP